MRYNRALTTTTVSRSVRFVRNVGAGVLGQIGVMMLSFFLTPRLIRALGIETYGLYVLFQAASGYVMIFCLGAGNATVKYVAEHAAEGGRGLRQSVIYGGSIYFLGSLVGAACL